MKNKLVFTAGMAVGYVLGARAGRDSYEQIKTKAQELWGNPTVQDTVSSTADTIKSKAPEVQDAVTDTLKNIGSNDSDDTKGSQQKTSQQSGKHSGSDKSSDGTSSNGKSSNGKSSDGTSPTTSASSGKTGPSGGDPRDIEETPFTAQDEDTRPELGKDFGK